MMVLLLKMFWLVEAIVELPKVRTQRLYQQYIAAAGIKELAIVVSCLAVAFKARFGWVGAGLDVVIDEIGGVERGGDRSTPPTHQQPTKGYQKGYKNKKEILTPIVSSLLR